MSEDKKKHINIEDGSTEREGAETAAKETAEDEADGLKEEASKAEEAKENASEETAEETAKGPEEEKKDEEAEKKAAEEAESERYMRLMAEFQNYKRRAAKEKTDTLQYANEKIIAELLPVLDNFERALETETEEVEAYVKGMQLIFEQLKTALGNAGLEEIKAMDEVFDPNVHNAVMTANVEDKDDGVITMVLQKGYKLKDKVVRPSMVAVNKK